MVSPSKCTEPLASTLAPQWSTRYSTTSRCPRRAAISSGVPPPATSPSSSSSSSRPRLANSFCSRGSLPSCAALYTAVCRSMLEASLLDLAGPPVARDILHLLQGCHLSGSPASVKS
nr:unnamed protein product [Mus musculus]